ncbi:MAG: glycosyltransferase family 39 protein [Parcubacteria group bacterium]|nr:glycosyltransferase family 39 protein [Parcubacteria group bacterium]
MTKPVKIILFIVVVLAAILRLWGLGSSELTFDEGLYAFRSIGYLDYLDSTSQTTPIQWLQNSALPAWLKLSFHDHPPLVFLVQHIFLKLFSDSLLVARLPSALGGIAAVFLLYLIGRRLQLQKRSLGLMAALLGSLSFALVSNSRLAMMEGILFPLLLLNIYYFLRFLENSRHWWKFGLILGLCFLTKYVSLFLMPIYALYLLINKSRLLKDKRLYLSLIIALTVFSPVIVYNIYSYKIFGHFDLQLASLLNQKIPWQGESGKSQEPFSNISENLLTIFSIPFLILASLGLVVILIRRGLRKELMWLPLAAVFITLMLIKIGSAIRFSSLYAIPATLLAALGLTAMRERYNKKWVLAPIAVFFVYELIFTVNLVFFSAPDYGVVKLDRYFNEIFGGARGPGLPSHPNPHLERVIQKYSANYPPDLKPTGLIYDDNLSLGPTLWLFSRRQYYHGIPIMPASAFEQKIKSGQTEMFKAVTLYFVKAEAASPLKPIQPSSAAGDVEQFLQKNGRLPDTIIKAAGNAAAFRVYKFSLQ